MFKKKKLEHCHLQNYIFIFKKNDRKSEKLHQLDDVHFCRGIHVDECHLEPYDYYYGAINRPNFTLTNHLLLENFRQNKTQEIQKIPQSLLEKNMDNLDTRLQICIFVNGNVPAVMYKNIKCLNWFDIKCITAISKTS